MSKNAIATVFYPSAKKYISEFLDSVRKQTSQDFVLIIFNNGLEDIKFYLDKIAGKYIISEVHDTPASIRVLLIKYLLKKEI